MAKSLQEQMLEAGLASSQQARAVRTQKRKQRKRGQDDSASADVAAAAVRAQREKAARDRELNLEREAAARGREQAAQRAQLIEAHRVERVPGDMPYRFDDAGRVASLYLADTQRADIVKGRLAIVRLAAEEYALVSDAGARRLAALHPDAVVVHHPSAAGDESDENDPYAGYEVPDDLMW